MDFAHGETVTRARAVPEVDAYGDVVGVTYSDLADIPNCAVYVESQSEVVEAGRSAVVARLTVLAPFGADLKAGDRVQRSGRWWEAKSVPESFRSPFTGWEAGCRIMFELVEG